MKEITCVALWSLALLFQGCSTLSDARQAKGQGTFKIYNAPIDKAWITVKTVLTELELPMAGENKEEGYILAQNGMSIGSSGENVAIFLEKAKEANKTRIEVVSKKAMSTQIFATNWEPKIIEKLDEKINLNTSTVNLIGIR